MADTVKWKIYYADHSTFTNLDGAWEDAPGWGVQFVMGPSPEIEFEIISSGDFYRMNSKGQLLKMDKVGLMDYVANIDRRIKVGRALSREDWLEIARIANGDRDFAVRTGQLPLEGRTF